MQEEKTESQISESSEAMKAESKKFIRHHVYASMGMGVIPVPFVDFAGVSGIQLNLIRKLAQLYNVPFSKDMVKNLIAALIGGAAPASLGRYLTSLLKSIPIAGTIAGITGGVIVGGASTYAVGKVFERHFSEGGTFLTFDPEKARAFYADMFREGKGVSADILGKNQK
jgi:uncharacterized protein (DUF697 family)